jgi:hypothetical protein
MTEGLVLLCAVFGPLAALAYVFESPSIRRLVVEIRCWWLDVKRAWRCRHDEEEESARMVSLSQWSNQPPQGRQRKSFDR